MKLPTPLVLATGNAHKITEIREILGTEAGALMSLADIPDMPPLVEDKATFEENAVDKAVQVMTFTGRAALADDSGLEVDFLDGEPGVRSARYSGGSAKDNNRLLLEKLKGVPPEKRAARFRCVMALAVPGRGPMTVQGAVKGKIIFEEQGRAGFGYDPLFVPEGHTRTFAEIPMDQKNAMSHRGRALRALIKKIKELP
jgi:XTP/dITP diphosphohydrolase